MNESDFRAHVLDLEERALAGDDFALKSLACIAWLICDDDGPDGGETATIIDFQAYLEAA